MFGLIKYNLTHLLDFRGRDARQTFWYYVLFLVVLYVVASILAAIPAMGSAMGEAMEAARSGATEQEIQERVLRGMDSQLVTTVWVSVIIDLVATLLLAAAFVRRLHDSGNSGWWAALAFAIKLGALGISVSQIGKAQEIIRAAADPAQLQQLASQSQSALGLIGWIPLIIVIVFGVMKSTDGPNRYGEAPVVF